MYVVTSIPLVRRTRATFRKAELGFLGVVVYTRVHTPRRCGQACNAGLAVLYRVGRRPLRTNCMKVGTNFLSSTDSIVRFTRKPAHAQHSRRFPNSRDPERGEDFGLAHTSDSVKSVRTAGPAPGRTLHQK